MSNFNAENDRFLYDIEHYLINNKASDFLYYFLRFNYDKILRGEVIMVLAPLDIALQRLVDKTGKSLEQISNLPEGKDVLTNFLSSTQFSYDPLYRAVNGTTYGKTHNDLPALKSSSHIKLGNLDVYTIDGIIRRNEQQINALSRANPPQNFQRRTVIIGDNLTTNFDDLPNPIIRQIALNLPLADLVDNCQINSQFNDLICDSEEFWNEKTRRDYPANRGMIGSSWKETYRLLVGKLYTFGSNSHGQLGLAVGAGASQDRPSLVKALKNVTAVSCGGNHTAAISNGQLYTWGWGASGELGHGDLLNQFKPKLLEGLKNVTAVSCGGSHTAVITDGQLYTFGSNGHEQLGYPRDLETQQTPKLVEGFNNVTSVSCGGFHTAAISNGRLYTFGASVFGQLGHGNTLYQSKPKLVEGLNNVTFVSCSSGHTAAISNGLLYTFGLNENGQLGLGDNNNRLTPTLVNELNNVTFVSGGIRHTAVISNGQLYTFGSGEDGQLGHGVPLSQSWPRIVEGLNNVTCVSVGRRYTAAISNGQLYTFGFGELGELGNGTNLDGFDSQLRPKLVEHLNNVSFVSCGNNHTAAIASYTI